MVTENSHCPISSVVRQSFCRNIVILIRELLKLFLKGDGGIVGTEHLGGEAGHEAVQVLIQDGGVEPVEEVVALLLAVREQLEVLEDALFHAHVVVVTNGIFTEEIEFYDVFFA